MWNQNIWDLGNVKYCALGSIFPKDLDLSCSGYLATTPTPNNWNSDNSQQGRVTGWALGLRSGQGELSIRESHLLLKQELLCKTVENKRDSGQITLMSSLESHLLCIAEILPWVLFGICSSLIWWTENQGKCQLWKGGHWSGLECFSSCKGSKMLSSQEFIYVWWLENSCCPRHTADGPETDPGFKTNGKLISSL